MDNETALKRIVLIEGVHKIRLTSPKSQGGALALEKVLSGHLAESVYALIGKSEETLPNKKTTVTTDNAHRRNGRKRRKY